MTLGQKLVTGSVKGDEKVAGDVKKEMLQREQRDGTRIEEWVTHLNITCLYF